jgi:hypothetical protein
MSKEIEQAEDLLWSAILKFANNTDASVSSELAEDVSAAIIELKSVVVMEAEGFVYSPCANPTCDVEYASGEYCSLCESNVAK